MSMAASQPQSAAPCNPFRGSVQINAWGSDDAGRDVTSIHRAAFERSCDAVEAVRTGASSAGIVIHGQAGSGKTHLIGRLRRRFTDRYADPTYEQLSQAFAYVQLNTHYSALKRHTRRCVANDLLRSFQGAPSQLERLVITRLMAVDDGGGHLALWWDHLLEARPDAVDSLLYELGNREGLSTDFVTVLGHIVRRRHRLEVAGWLRGDQLTESAYERLEIAPPNPEDDPEQAALYVLTNLMKLAGPEIPLVLCFDQVEALQVSRDENFPLFAFAQMIVDLFNADRNLVLISCMQTEYADLMLRQIPEYALARMKGFAVCQLLPLNIDQARELLSLRLHRRSGPSEDATPDLSPLTERDLLKFLGTHRQCSPRELLDRAARRFDELQGKPPSARPLSEGLAAEWDRRSDAALRCNTPDESEAILRDGLPRLIHVVDANWSSRPGERGQPLDYVFAGPQSEALVGVQLCEGANATGLWRRLRKLNDQYPERINPRLHKLLLLRDERTPIRATAVKTRELIDCLEKKDALFYRVAPEALAALDALRKLLADSQAGDLDIDGESVSAPTVLDWLRDHLAFPLKELADVVVTQSSGELRSTLIDRLQEQLVEHCVAAADALAAELGVSATELTDAAKGRPDLFGVIDGTTTAIFSVRFGGRCAAAALKESVV